MERVTSRQNSVAKRVRALGHGTSDDDAILLEGPHLLDEALTSGVNVQLAVFGETPLGGRLKGLAERAQRARVRVLVASDKLLNALSPVRAPSGVVAVAARPTHTSDTVFERRPHLLLVLHNVQDPGNVGAIIRAAEACGATGVVAGEGSADPFGWKALRGAMGSTFRLPLLARARLDEVLRRMKRDSVRVLTTVPRGGRPPADADLRSSVAILLGGEGAGMPPSLEAAADDRLTIPMHGSVESLNVAIAAAMILYEASRQRTHVAVR